MFIARDALRDSVSRAAPRRAYGVNRVTSEALKACLGRLYEEHSESFWKRAFAARSCLAERLALFATAGTRGAAGGARLPRTPSLARASWEQHQTFLIP